MANGIDGRHMDTRRALRRQLVAMAARRQRPGAGSDLRALDERRVVLDWWAEVERAVEGVPHAVVGAVATNAYAPERLTRDLDMAVLAADAGRAEAALRAAGWRRTGALALVGGSAWRDVAGHDLDLIALAEAWAGEAVAAAQDNRIAGLPTLPLPYLVCMKLLAGRTTDVGDVSRMLGRATDEQVAAARAVVARYGDQEDLDDFDQLLRMGRLERGLDARGRAPEPPT